jgi:hypothetical protein
VALGRLATELDDCVRRALSEAADLFQARGVGIAGEDGQADVRDVIRAVAPGLMNALLEQHEPELGAALREWEEQAAALVKSSRSLVEQARAGLAMAGLPEADVEALQGWFGQEVLETFVMGKAPLSFRVEEGDEGKAKLVHRDGGKMERALYEGSGGDVERAKKAYELVLDRAGSGNLPGEAREAHEALASSARRIEETLVEMVIRGRPQGECSMCPGRPRRR